jgi:hypothetical protein
MIVRIAYLARWDISHESGILKKMAAQMRTWQAFGHEVRFFAFSPGTAVWSGLEELNVNPVQGDGFGTRLLQRRSLSDPILRWQPDVTYVRWSTWYPAWEAVIERVPSVIELNGDDLRENRVSLPFPLYLVHRATRHRLLSRARGFVSVSAELAESEIFTRFGVPTKVVGNGVDLERIGPLPAPDNRTPRLVFLAYGQRPWHGTDKLARLAALCPDWHFDVVGLDHLEGAQGPRHNIHLHGLLPVSSYIPILARADVAVGTLALHRRKLDRVSTLKTGEYLAHGIPTIIGYEETDFPNGHPLLLTIPNTPSNVEDSIDLIRSFVDRARGERVDRSSIAHLDLRVKEEERLDFLSSFVAAR